MEAENFDTIVGEEVTLTGSISNSGSILINGTVKGDVNSQQAVVIGQNAMVEGPITGNTVQVSGTVEGAVTAHDTLEMLPESKVTGDIKAGVLHIQPGAQFNGTASMSRGDAASPIQKEAATVETTTDEEKDDNLTDKKPKPKLEVED